MQERGSRASPAFDSEARTLRPIGRQPHCVCRVWLGTAGHLNQEPAWFLQEAAYLVTAIRILFPKPPITKTLWFSALLRPVASCLESEIGACLALLAGDRPVLAQHSWAFAFL